MADLNEPKKETVRITLPPPTTHGPTVPVEKETARINLPNRPPDPPPGAKPPAPNLPRPSPAPVRPPPALVTPKSGAVRPPLPPAMPTAKTPLPPPPGAKAPVSPPPVAKAPVAPPPAPSGVKEPPPPPVGTALPKPVFPPINPPIENRGVAQTGARKETARIADSPMKATVKLSNLQPASVPSAPIIRAAPPAVANPPPQSLVETVPTQLCWALLGIAALILLFQLWTYFA